MKAALISLQSESSKQTLEEMKKVFTTVEDIDLREIEINFSGNKAEVLYRGKELNKYDCIFAKGSFRYATILRSLTSILGKNTYLPISASAFTIAHDKLLTQLKLEQKEIPMPRTYLAATTDAARKILERMNYPIIMKFPQGTQGKGIMFADSYPSASSILDALSALNQPFIIQEYVDTGGTDIRAIVVGDTVVAGMKRRANINEIRANVHSGGKGEALELDAATKKVALKAAHAIGAEICGVDILETPKGPVVIEVNVSPGLQAITESTSINVAEKIAKHLAKRTKTFSETVKSSSTAQIMSDIEASKKQELITNLDFRGSRILVPEMISKAADFKETDDVSMTAEKGKIVLKKFS